MGPDKRYHRCCGQEVAGRNTPVDVRRDAQSFHDDDCLYAHLNRLPVSTSASSISGYRTLINKPKLYLWTATM